MWVPIEVSHDDFTIDTAENQILLAASSFEHRGGDVRIDGFVLDMPLIFEGFLTHALRAALLSLDPTTTVRGQFPGFLDEDDQVPMRPDIVWLSSANRPLAVIDAKYKAERISGYPNADVYQALAYATALGLPDAHLVYARGNEPVSSYLIRGSGVRVHAHALDLSLPPADLLHQISGLARLVLPRNALNR